MNGEQLTEAQRDRGKLDLLRFTALNALSFEVLAGQILILFARQVGASLAEIGLLSALLPFASVIQLALSPLINRYGPRVLMLIGWTARTAVAAGLFLVPAAAAHGGGAAATRVLLFVMGGFYLCRAIGMSSWLPMVQEIVRPEDRGLYLSRQEWLRQVSIVAIAVLTALYLVGVQGVGRFMHVIAIGVVAAAWSLYYLWRVPDVGSTPEPFDKEYLRRALSPLRDRVFGQYLFFSITMRMVLSAFGPFQIVFLREALHLPASGVIIANTVGSLGAIATLPWWGRWSDRVGAKPAVAVSLGGVMLGLLLWPFTGEGGPLMWPAIGAISLIGGVFMGGLTVSTSKFELGFIPVRGRAHYVAANVATVGIGSGLATLAAGWLLQALRETDFEIGVMVWDRYRIFFALCALALAVPVLVRTWLPEERSRSIRWLVTRELRRRSRRWRRTLGARRGG